MAVKKTTQSVKLNELRSINNLKTSLGFIIAAFAFILYAQSITFNYTMDDHSVTDQNKYIKMGIASIPTLMKTDYFYGFKKGVRGPIYRPASLIMFAIEWNIFPDNPSFYHFMNVLLFAFTCWLLFVLLCKLFEKKFYMGGILFSFICCLLYAAHPIHTEVVNSIKSRDEILCFLFGVLSIFFVVKSVSNKFILYLFLGCMCYLLSSISKETGITFLIIIPLTVFVFTDTSKRKFAVISLSLLIVAMIYFFIRFETLKSIPLNTSDTYMFNSLVSAPSYISRQATAFYVLLKYILLLIFPNPLTCDYNFSMINIQAISDLPAIAGILVNVSLGIYAIINLQKKSILSFGILFYFITLAPVSNVFFLNGATMAERFMYIPSFGFCIILTYFLIKFFKTKLVKSSFQNLSRMISLHSSLFVFLSILLGLYSIKTFSRSMNWKDNYSLFSHDVITSNNSVTAHGSYAISILKELYPNEKDEIVKHNLLDSSISEFKKSLEIFPNYRQGYEGIGKVYYVKKEYEKSISIFQTMYSKGMNFDKDDFNDIASDFYELGVKYDEQRQYDKSISALDSALKYKPQDVQTYIAKGKVFGAIGKDILSNEMFIDAISINPKSTEALKDLGVNYGSNKQYKKALEYFNKSLAVDSTDGECYKFIGTTYQILGDSITAKQYLEKASRMSGGQQR